MSTTKDSSILGEVTRSVDQLCSQLSLSGIQVPRIDKCQDIFEFINEYELVTETLSEPDRIKLLVKAFPPGRFKTYYQSVIKPLTTWDTIRTTLTKRYSDTEDQDHHLRRVLEMKYEPNGKVKLYDYIEELLYSFVKAFPKESDDESQIRFIKSNLPNSIKPSLAIFGDFATAKTLDKFLPVFKQYDLSRSRQSEPKDDKREQTTNSELLTLFKDFIKEIRQDREARKVVAALQPSPRSQSPRQSSSLDNKQHYQRETSSPRSNLHTNQQTTINPYYQQRAQRSPSPGRKYIDNNQNYQHSNKYYQQPNFSNSYTNNQPINQPGYNQYQRGKSPPNQQAYSGTNYMQNNVNQQQCSSCIANQQQVKQPITKAFDDQVYFNKFGVPSSPCNHCGYMHLPRHCPLHLN